MIEFEVEVAGRGLEVWSVCERDGRGFSRSGSAACGSFVGGRDASVAFEHDRVLRWAMDIEDQN